MGTEVMTPQDCLVDRFTAFHRRRNFSGHGDLKQNNSKGNKKTSPKHDQNKRSNTKEEISKKSRDGGAAYTRRHDKISLVMGQITLLRKGESLDSLTAKIKNVNHQIEKSQNQIPTDDTAAVQGGDRIVPKRIQLAATDTYAGSGFFLSPSPRALPLPSFFNNKKQENNGGIVFHDSVTRDLRRMFLLE